MTYRSGKVPCVNKGPAGALTNLSGSFDIAYIDAPGSARGAFVMPSPWYLNTDSRAKYLNRDAPLGGGVKIGGFKQAQNVRVSARSMGDGQQLDIVSGPPGPSGVLAIATVNNSAGGVSTRVCTRWSIADGSVIKTGGRARKSSAGYDLTRLMVGSEGTLGIITEITLRLYPQPEALAAAVCAFPSVDAAVRTVIQTIQLGIPVARCELLDALTIRAVNRHSGLDLREAPMLFCEFHGTQAAVEEQSRMVQEIARELGGLDFEWATKQEDRTRLWQARHDAYPACRRLRPGNLAFSTDVCVPISQLARCIAESNEDIAGASMPIALFGHVGDGNFHLVVLIDPHNPADVAEADEINRRVVMRALRMGGTCTGEHGIGLGKLDFLDAEHGSAVQVMAAIKQALDPHNVLNPGKVVRTL